MTAKKSWENTFPAKLESQAESLLFCQRILYITYCQIAQGRGLLPPDAFKKRRLEGLRLTVLNTADKSAVELSENLKGACEALSKGYLREFHLIIGNDEKLEKVSEVFKMLVVYEEDVPTLELKVNGRSAKIAYRGEEHVKDETRNVLIRLSKIMMHLQVLPEQVYYNFYIIYDDDRTPKGYQARSFNRRPDPYTLADDIQGVFVGDVHSGKHTCVFDIKSVYIDDSAEFEERLSGDHAAVVQPLLSGNSTMDNTMDDDSSALIESTRKIALNEQAEKTLLARAAAGQDRKTAASSPEERSVAALSPGKKVRAKAATPSPKTLKATKTIRRTPGGGLSRSIVRRTRA